MSICVVGRWVGWSLASAVLLGCGGLDRASVAGAVVREDGAPVANARIVARSESGKSAHGMTDENGHYMLGGEIAGDGVPPGEYTVIVMEELPEMDPPPQPTIAAKYARPTSSGLSFNVGPGETKTYDMTLEGAD